MVVPRVVIPAPGSGGRTRLQLEIDIPRAHVIAPLVPLSVPALLDILERHRGKVLTLRLIQDDHGMLELDLYTDGGQAYLLGRSPS